MLQVMNRENPELVALQDKLKKTVGERLAQARGKYISQAAMADELRLYGIERTQGSISQIEKGLRLPSLEMFYVMVKHLGCSADYVLGLTDETLSPADIEEERLASALSHLPKDKREQVISYAEYLASQEQVKATRTIDAYRQWIAVTEVLTRRLGNEGEESLIDLLSADRPDLAAALGILPKEKSAQEG